MGILDRFKKAPTFYNIFSGFYGNTNNIKRFNQDLAYVLAMSLPEIFTPIDQIASRVSSITYEIQDKNGKKVEPTKHQKILMERPNPFFRFSDLIYSLVFAELSDGNSYLYRVDSGSTPRHDYISNLWALQPNLVNINTKYSTPDIFKITDKADLVSSYEIQNKKISPECIIHNTSSFFRNFNNLDIKGQSPLLAVEKNINNLLAVYAARFKVYENNGMAGILTKASKASGSSVEEVYGVNDSASRDDIVRDILNRNGLTGGKRLWDVIGYPVQFIKTLATISELQPFEETEADAIAIAGVFGVDKELIPKKGSTTFTNKRDAEKSLWQNTIKGICWDICNILDKAFLLPEYHRFVPLFDDVEVLQEDAKVKLESDKLMIENIKAINEYGLNNDAIAKKY